MVSKKQSTGLKITKLFSKKSSTTTQANEKDAEETIKQNTKKEGLLARARSKVNNIKHSSQVKRVTKSTDTLVATHKFYAEQVGKKCTLTSEFVMKLFKSNANNNANNLIRYSLAVSFAVSLYQSLYLYSVQIPFTDIVKTIPLLLKGVTVPNQQNIAENDFVLMFLEYFDKDNRLVDTLVTKAINSLQQDNASKLVITCTQDNLFQYLLEEVNVVVECFMNIWLPYFDLYQRNKKAIGEIDKSFPVDFNPDGEYIKDDELSTFDSVLQVINPPTLDIIAKDVYDKFMEEVVMENVRNHARLITPEKLKKLSSTPQSSPWIRASRLAKGAKGAKGGAGESNATKPVQIYLVEVKDDVSKTPKEATQYCDDYENDIRKYAQQYIKEFYDSLSIQESSSKRLVPNLRIRYFQWIDAAANEQINPDTLNLFDNIVFRKHIIDMRKIASKILGNNRTNGMSVDDIINDLNRISEFATNKMKPIMSLQNRQDIIQKVCKAFDPENKLYKQMNQKNNTKQSKTKTIECPNVAKIIWALWKSKSFIAKSPPNDLLAKLLQSGLLNAITGKTQNEDKTSQNTMNLISEQVDALIKKFTNSNSSLQEPKFEKLDNINDLASVIQNYLVNELRILGKVFDVEGRSLIGIVMKLSKMDLSKMSNLIKVVNKDEFLKRQTSNIVLVCKDDVGPRNCLINNTYYVNFETFMFKLLVSIKAVISFMQNYETNKLNGGFTGVLEVIGIIMAYLIVVFFISVMIGIMSNDSRNCEMCCVAMTVPCCLPMCM